MRYTKEMQIGKKQRRKKHKPSIIQRKDGRCYLCMLLNEDNGAKKTQEKYGFFSKYLPEETREIFSAIDHADPLDLLWHQIQLAYAAIIRAQRIAYVKDQDDKTKEIVMSGETSDMYSVQQAWDKQNNFLKAQARAQGELRNMIKQYDEMLHKNWEAASEEQRARIAQMKAQTERLAQAPTDGEEDGVEIINDADEKAGQNIRDSNTEVPSGI